MLVPPDKLNGLRLTEHEDLGNDYFLVRSSWSPKQRGQATIIGFKNLWGTPDWFYFGSVHRGRASNQGRWICEIHGPKGAHARASFPTEEDAIRFLKQFAKDYFE